MGLCVQILPRLDGEIAGVRCAFILMTVFASNKAYREYDCCVSVLRNLQCNTPHPGAFEQPFGEMQGCMQ